MNSDLSFSTIAKGAGVAFDGAERPVICVLGLGFVGAAMAVAVSEAQNDDQTPCFNVVGIDLPTDRGQFAIRSLNSGSFPADSNDQDLAAAVVRANRRGNLVATSDQDALALAEIVIIDINLDLGPQDKEGDFTVDFTSFLKAIESVGNRIRPGCLVLVETTVPPGTCSKIVYPKLCECFERRGLPRHGFHLAHSYERVMPGDHYLKSITNFWRVYAGYNEAAADRCEDFLKKITNYQEFPMTRLDNTVASETAKVLENSYRATNIAFMEEWGRFAENVGVDLFQVLDAIRMRPTHNNIRQPGFGVGGYCLTKDPLFARAAAKHIFHRPDLDFPFSKRAVSVNNAMPIVSVERLMSMLGGTMKGKHILLFGISYRPDVGDTRYSPSETFAKEATERGARLSFHDPLVRHWEALGIGVSRDLPSPEGIDALVFAVGHREYKSTDFVSWLRGCKPAILDANQVLTSEQSRSLRALGCRVESIGRGSAA